MVKYVLILIIMGEMTQGGSAGNDLFDESGSTDKKMLDGIKLVENGII